MGRRLTDVCLPGQNVIFGLLDRTYLPISRIASAPIGHRGKAEEKSFIVFADRGNYGFRPDRCVKIGGEDPSHVPNDATSIGVNSFQMAFSLAPSQQVIREALGNLNHMVFESAIRPIQTEMRVSPKGREVVDGERIAVAYRAAGDDVLQLRGVRHFRLGSTQKAPSRS